MAGIGFGLRDTSSEWWPKTDLADAGSEQATISREDALVIGSSKGNELPWMPSTWHKRYGEWENAPTCPDLSGLDGPDTLLTDLTFEEMARLLGWLLNGMPVLSPRHMQQLARGCIGVASVALGDFPSFENCYSTRQQASVALSAMKKASPRCCGMIYGIHLHESGGGKDPNKPDTKKDDNTGRVDLSNWDEQGSPVNFDYGIPVGDKILSGSTYHNPNGKYFKDLKPNEGAVYYVTPADKWTFRPEGNGLNVEVWCAQCRGDDKYV